MHFGDVDALSKEKVVEESQARDIARAVASGPVFETSIPQKLKLQSITPSTTSLLCDPSPSAPYTIMLQQTLARSLQTFSRQSQILSTPRVACTPFSVARLRVAPAASQQLSVRRWYSSTEESDKKQEEMLKDSPEAKAEDGKDASKDDPVQKELENKKKENLDLTVCLE